MTSIPMISKTKNGILNSVKLNFERLCRKVDSDSVLMGEIAWK